MSFGKVVKEARLKKGLTQEQLGDLIGVQKSAIAKYESEKVINIKKETMKKLCVFLGIDPLEFVELEKEEGDELEEKIARSAERLREALDKSGMKQIELAEKAGIGKSLISCYLSGRYEPKPLMLNKLGKALNVSEMWLAGYDVPVERTADQKEAEEINIIMNKVKKEEGFRNMILNIMKLKPEQIDVIKNLVSALLH